MEVTKTENNDAPAFPSHGSIGEVATEGMSLRDYFAGQALPQAISIDSSLPVEVKRDSPANIARLAYLYADAMLAERVK